MWRGAKPVRTVGRPAGPCARSIVDVDGLPVACWDGLVRVDGEPALIRLVRAVGTPVELTHELTLRGSTPMRPRASTSCACTRPMVSSAPPARAWCTPRSPLPPTVGRRWCSSAARFPRPPPISPHCGGGCAPPTRKRPSAPARGAWCRATGTGWRPPCSSSTRARSRPQERSWRLPRRRSPRCWGRTATSTTAMHGSVTRPWLRPWPRSSDSTMRHAATWTGWCSGAWRATASPCRPPTSPASRSLRSGSFGMWPAWPGPARFGSETRHRPGADRRRGVHRGGRLDPRGHRGWSPPCRLRGGRGSGRPRGNPGARAYRRDLGAAATGVGHERRHRSLAALRPRPQAAGGARTVGLAPAPPVAGSARTRPELGWTPAGCRLARSLVHGGTEPDGAALLLVVLGLLPPSDPRSTALVDATIGELGIGEPVVALRRYPACVDAGFDGVESAFVPVSWWAVSALAQLGRRTEAHTLADRLCAAIPGLQPRDGRPGRRRWAGKHAARLVARRGRPSALLPAGGRPAGSLAPCRRPCLAGGSVRPSAAAWAQSWGRTSRTSRRRKSPSDPIPPGGRTHV